MASVLVQKQGNPSKYTALSAKFLKKWMKFWVLMVVTVKIEVLWAKALCGFVGCCCSQGRSRFP